MTASPAARPQVSGLIELPRQRDRARGLLKRLRDGSATGALAQLAARRRDMRPPVLADAQWLIARELGFPSWPALKAHADAIRFAAEHPAFAADDEAATTHWRCGNDIAHSLTVAGFRGRFRMFSDPLCMGPVHAGRDHHLAARSRYLAAAFDVAPDDIRARLEREYRDLDTIGGTGSPSPAGAPGSNRHVLWCEADPYDQLFLVAALAHLHALPERLELIAIDRVPGVERFIGIGQLAPELLAWLWPQRRPVGAAALRLARHAWEAFCAQSPEPLADFASHEHPELPLLAPALRRQLRELPSAQHGLSLTEHLALQIVAEHGSIELGRVFAELMSSREPLPTLGDLMFHALMRPLMATAEPLLRGDPGPRPGGHGGAGDGWPHCRVMLTPLGQAVLAGQANWIDHTGADRWVGGIRIAPRSDHWAISADGVPVWRHGHPTPRPATSPSSSP